MTNHPSTDRDTLTQKAYATEESLIIRQRTHDLYSVPKIDFPEWVLDRVTWRGDERILDIGSGTGKYFEALRKRLPQGQLISGDLSLGMSSKAAQHLGEGLSINADIQALPFADHSFDVVLAGHVLHHVPDLERAVSELHRIVKPSGCLLTAANSEFNLPELEQLVRRTLGLLGASIHDFEDDDLQGFYLETGAVRLARHFYAVARYDLPGELVFPSKQPVLDYVNSTRAFREVQLPPRVAWEDFIHLLGEQIQRQINHFGELAITKLSGAIVATDKGDFAHQYINVLADSHPPNLGL